MPLTASSTQDTLISSYSTLQKQKWTKFQFKPSPSGAPIAMFVLPGTPQGVAPSTSAGAVCTSATAGAYPYTAASGGAVSYLSRVFVSGGTGGLLILYDRLWANAGLVGNISTLQSFTMPSITRYNTNATSKKNELWLETYTALGATAVIAQATYTNQDGVGSKIATTDFNGAVGAQALNCIGAGLRFMLAAGDTGVQSVQDVTLTTPAGTAGNFGLTIRRRLHTGNMAQFDVGQNNRFTETGLIAITEASSLGACLEWVYVTDNVSFAQSDNYMNTSIVQI